MVASASQLSDARVLSLAVPGCHCPLSGDSDGGLGVAALRHPPVPGCPWVSLTVPVPSLVTVMVASASQLSDARVPLEQRDFCGHHLVRLLRCQRDNFPVPWGCHALRHAWDSCQHEDYVMRMKEFERERRLRLRQQRLRKRHGDSGDSE
ncbi:NADH dehydrogenase [ubiquinone] 1 beta subcomplex subunit 7 isoform X1 [Ammospiza caudacuta]|uniref:NADH dehydrogenase [ubiquinone] 1 beta subcomplex subunit 7 isoform X1 n=1 Tax=Ammospiza caudacuta TaxID=2857398 RepID=UPI00273834EE|nr:NADH dehydrogenase [ubiquinone] 1 beta subcomplex subunit 7 isoform X1 [Ammospiza caudacuta]XP_058677393.1 NADH dehydrogenase [ubiquinone] 1 beta subcomplex subunit 7 isoform X1 [Ammospiza caudacuta]